MFLRNKAEKQKSDKLKQYATRKAVLKQVLLSVRLIDRSSPDRVALSPQKVSEATNDFPTRF